LPSIFFLLPFTPKRIVSGFLTGVLTIVCGFSRGRFLLFVSLFTSEQDEDTERKDSLLTSSFSGDFVIIFVFFGSDKIFLAICDDVLFVGDFCWELNVFLVVADCSVVFCNNSCPLGDTATTILRDLSTERFCLLEEPYGIVELFITVPDESTLVCTPLASFSFCFCKAFLISTDEEISAGDLLSLLHDCSCSFFVKRSFSLFALDKG